MSDATDSPSQCAYCGASAADVHVTLNYDADEDDLVCEACQYAADPTPLHGLSAFQRDLLTAVAALDGGGATDISNELDDHYPELVSQGRVYPNVRELCNRGFLIEHDRELDTPAYRLSESGETALHNYRQWLAASLKTGGSN